MTAEELEAGYGRAYRDFYRWGSIFRGASTKATWLGQLRHLAYAGGWKKFEPLWDWIIRTRRAGRMLPMLEQVLTEFGQRALPQRRARERERVADAYAEPQGAP